jgi:hypothetical protein
VQAQAHRGTDCQDVDQDRGRDHGHAPRGGRGHMSLRRGSWASPHLRPASSGLAVRHMRDVDSLHAEKDRRAGCSMRRGALEGRESSRCRGELRLVVGRNRRDNCLRRRECFLQSTVYCC